jgi:PAS domain S-box-containing protein
MTVPWSPVVIVDIFGPIATLLLAFRCAFFAWQWTRKKTDDVFRNYIFLLTLAIVCFAISRSFGHLVKQILLLNGLGHIWKQISPFSGAINSAIFIVIFAFGIYFHRFQKVHLEIEKYKNNLELLVKERTAELAKTNSALENEIIERREAEEKIRQSKSTLENVLNSSNPLCITSVDHEILQANNSYYEIWPRDTDTEDQLKCFESRPGIYCHTELCPVRQIKQGKQEVSLETTKELSNGDKLEFIVTARPFKNADGELIGIVESFQDITKRKKVEKSLAAEREQLAVTLRSIGDGVITTDISGNIVLINKIAETLTGWQQHEAVGRPLPEVFHIIDQKSRKPSENPVEKVITSGDIIALPKETVLISRNGEERIISDSGAPIRDKRSQVIGVVVVFRDVTEQIRMEEELQKVKKLESVGILAGGIAHDFNNILVAILGNLDLACQFIDPESKPYKLLQNAEKASIRASDLTQQLLTFSKGGAPVRQTSSIAEIIKDSASFVLHGTNVACLYDIPEDLWLVHIDKGQMSQVIQNIIINAKQAMPEGGTIQITCENIKSNSKEDFLLPPMHRYVKITITDSGSGIHQEVVDSIFDPYFSTKEEGSGLGLAVTHSIVKKHDGHITVDSRPGQGTTFTIYLPASPEEQQDIDEEDMEVHAEGTGRIMIMDDEEMVRNVGRVMLEELGYEVVCVENGDEAVRLFQESQHTPEPIDLIIMDLTIPGGMGGKETAQKILQIDPHAKIIVSSGYSNDPVLADFRAYGFCSVIIKPYVIQELRNAISKALQ